MPTVKIVQIDYDIEVPGFAAKGLNPVTIYPECPYFKPEYDDEDCTHPKTQWGRCCTNHMVPIDEQSCMFNIHEELSKEEQPIKDRCNFADEHNFIGDLVSNH